MLPRWYCKKLLLNLVPLETNFCCRKITSLKSKSSETFKIKMIIATEFLAPESPVLHEQQNTRVLVDNKDLGVGTIYVSERTLCWKTQEGAGFSIEYPRISMHAISTDPTIYSSQCIYIMIDGQLRMPGDTGEDLPTDDKSDDNAESESDVSQIVLAPTDLTSINAIYDALNQCQTLNPEPDDDNIFEDAEDYYDEFVHNDIAHHLGAGGDTEMNHLSSQLQNSININNFYGNGDQNFDDDQFEDAD